MATADSEPASAVQAGPFAPINRVQLLDAYAGVNLGNWEIVVGRQSLSWGPGPDGSMLWSDNAPPVDMVRLVNPEPLHLPRFLRFLGPVPDTILRPAGRTSICSAPIRIRAKDKC